MTMTRSQRGAEGRMETLWERIWLPAHTSSGLRGAVSHPDHTPGLWELRGALERKKGPTFPVVFEL